MNLYSTILHAHNGFRWIVLLVLFFSIILAFRGWLGKHAWDRRDKTSGLLLIIFMDIQFLTGCILYIFASPVTKAAFNNFGAAMKNEVLRFYAVEHLLIMTIALILVHIGRVKSKKNIVQWKRHRSAAVFYGLSLLLVLAAIPWNRSLM